MSVLVGVGESNPADQFYYFQNFLYRMYYVLVLLKVLLPDTLTHYICVHLAFFHPPYRQISVLLRNAVMVIYSRLLPWKCLIFHFSLGERLQHPRHVR